MLRVALRCCVCCGLVCFVVYVCVVLRDCICWGLLCCFVVVFGLVLVLFGVCVCVFDVCVCLGWFGLGSDLNARFVLGFGFGVGVFVGVGWVGLGWRV